jgi:DNA invertase Pin-like site-specific DNA recombinase
MVSDTIRGMGRAPKCTKAVAYVRASTGKQEITPEMQREKIEAYCKMAGLDLVDVIVEKGVSAKLKLSKRPEGARVQRLIRDGVCHVVALKLDRLFRNAADALATTEEWREAGISLHLVDMGGMSLDTGSSMRKMFLAVISAFAEIEANVISERTAAALRHKRAHGQVFNHAPYGYDAVDGALVPNAREMSVLERMRELRAEMKPNGKPLYGYAAIADELNGAGIVAKNGGQWHAFSVQKVLGAAR